MGFTTVANDGAYKFMVTNVKMDFPEWHWNAGPWPPNPHSDNPPFNTERYYTMQRMGSTLNSWSEGVANTPVAGNANATDTSALTIFGPIPGGTYTNTGNVAEFALFNRALSTTEIDTIHTYIKRRYSL